MERSCPSFSSLKCWYSCDTRSQIYLGSAAPGFIFRSRWWKCGVLWDCPPTPHSIGDPPSEPQVWCCCQINYNELCGGYKGCLDLRRHAFALDGQVSAEWSRSPGSMARRARDSVAPLQRSWAGWMPARIGRLSAGVGRRHPDTIRKTRWWQGR